MNLLLDLVGLLVFFGTLAAIFEAEEALRRRIERRALSRTKTPEGGADA